MDNDEEVLRATRLALDGFTFERRGLQFLFASSAAGARDILVQNRDIALILLDIVMESQSAGLELVKFIRQSLGDKLVRIVVQTGQLSRALLDDVMRLHDIDGYHNKTEMTFHRLWAVVHRALCIYQELRPSA